MQKIFTFALCVLMLAACDKHDPILPGTRVAIFDDTNVNVKNESIKNIPESAIVFDNFNCPYTQDSSNTIWDGTRRIFSGFATNNSVISNQKPVCSGNYIYAGLTTGELIKINPKTRKIIWVADIYRASNLTGGASMVDIVAPIIPHKNSVYVGSLGDAFCRVNANSGAKQWCVNIGVSAPFVITDDYAFVVGDDDYLYAVATKNGDVLWRTEIKKQVAPIYEKGIISVGNQQINAENGKNIK